MSRQRTGPGEPPARQVTVRDALCEALQSETLSAREISAAVGISERDVAGHLEHLRRSVRRQGRHLQVIPASCHHCGFEFSKRTRLDRPGRCPRCRGESLSEPRFHLE